MDELRNSIRRPVVPAEKPANAQLESMQENRPESRTLKVVYSHRTTDMNVPSQSQNAVSGDERRVLSNEEMVMVDGSDPQDSNSATH